jgi:hypothetical protein
MLHSGGYGYPEELIGGSSKLGQQSGEVKNCKKNIYFKNPTKLTTIFFKHGTFVFRYHRVCVACVFLSSFWWKKTCFTAYRIPFHQNA